MARSKNKEFGNGGGGLDRTDREEKGRPEDLRSFSRETRDGTRNLKALIPTTQITLKDYTLIE